MVTKISDPYPVISDLDGTPLENGYVYIGMPGLDAEAFPKAVFWDAGLTVPATQPIRTIAGRFADLGSQIGNIYTEGGYSILVKDKNLVTVFSASNDTDPTRSYDTFAEFIADSQTFPAGDYVTVTDISAVYQATAGAGSLGAANAGGQQFDVLPSADGTYSARAFGLSTGLSVAQADTYLQNAFDAMNAGDTLVIEVGGKVTISDATLSTNGVVLVLGAGTELQQSNATLASHCIKVTGDDCSLVGFGILSSEITGLADYAATGSGMTRSIVHWTGDDPVVDGIRGNTPSRTVFFFDRCTNPTIKNCSGDGGYLLADYNPASTLNLYFAYYSYSGVTGETSTFKVTGCNFTHFMSAIASGALSGPGSYKPYILGNNFTECWDHCMYVLGTVGGLISNNQSQDCRLPAAVDMDGVTYQGNRHYWSVSSGFNAEAGLSMRNMRNGAICRDNHLIGGMGGYIDARPVNGTYDAEDIEITDNVLQPDAATATLLESIRVENSTGTMLRAKVLRNRITNYSSGGFGAIRVAGTSGSEALNCQVEDNQIKLVSSAFGVRLVFADNLSIKRNSFDRSGYTATATLDFVFGSDSDNAKLSENVYIHETGGTGVTARGVNLATTCASPTAVDENFARLTPASGAVVPFPVLGTGGVKVRPRYSNDPMSGEITIPSGTGATADQSNGNVRSDTRMALVPVNTTDGAGAGNIVATVGVEMDYRGVGLWRVLTGTASSTPNAGTFAWQIL